MRPRPPITRHSLREAQPFSRGARGKEALHILLAEDNIVNQKMAVRMLEKRGHRTVVASNGREAIEKLKEELFDLVLMDIQMPEMDGLTATREIRKWKMENRNSEDSKGGHQDQVSNIPIIAITAHAMKGDREKCLEAGMDDYVTKPIKAEELFEVMEQVVSQVRSRSRANKD